MKQLTTLLIALLFASQAFADCASGSVSVYPTNRDINENSLIIIKGFGSSQGFVDSIGFTHSAYLEAEGHKVKLIPIARHKGAFLVTQVILKPEKKLEQGKLYSLSVSHLAKGEKSYFSQWNSITKKSEAYTWVVEYHVDFTEPVWKKKPIFVSSKVQHYGCGPAVNATFSLEITDRSNVLIHTNLIDITAKDTTTYYLHYEGKGTLNVGRGMCSGAFNYQPKHKYKIRFRLLDYSGNTSDKWTDWILFDSPFDKKE